jgi:D-alanine transfer protein
LHGKKVAISLSPGWFLKPNPTWNGYKGNFSPMAANELIFGTALGFELKRDIALRMLQCPSTLENRPLLEFALKLLSSGRWLDRALFCVLWPVGKMEVSLLELEDHLAAFNYIRHDIKPASPAVPEILDWPKLIARVETTKSTDLPNASKSSRRNLQITPGAGEMGFRSGVNACPTWIDLELLLRTLASVHAQPLLLSMPLPGQFYDHAGVSRSAREDYYTKLRALVQRYHFAVVEFEGHDEDPAFLLRHQSHLTAKGWMYYDRALDDFFHGRVPRS